MFVRKNKKNKEEKEEKEEKETVKLETVFPAVYQPYITGKK